VPTRCRGRRRQEGRELSGAAWPVERLRGHPADLHGDDLPDPVVARVRVLEPTEAALVLGSTQAAEGVEEAAVVLGLDVVRRRSGGGAVLVAPGDPLWVDVDLPVSHARWDPDVGRSFAWLGEAWAAALAEQGVDTDVHRGPYEPGRWGSRVCFAGRGPGEVFAARRKVVGMAQRRTRAGARFQCAVPRVWEPEPLVSLVIGHEEREDARADLAGAAGGVDLDPGVLVAALVAHLGSP
jgi:lipoate---protein ligase